MQQFFHLLRYRFRQLITSKWLLLVVAASGGV